MARDALTYLPHSYAKSQTQEGFRPGGAPGSPGALACLLASSSTLGTHSTMGVMVKNFRDAVN